MTGSSDHGLRPFEDYAVGETGELNRVITAADVARFVELTGDDNPVHVDDEFAAKVGAGGRVVHGMLAAGYVSTVIGTILPGPGALWLSERFNFRSPVRIDDRIHVQVRVRHLSPATRVLVLDVKVENQHGNVVLDGEAQVQVLEGITEVSDNRKGAETVVVTGAGRGIGAAVAKRLAGDGLRVIVNFRADEARAAETVRSIVDAGQDASLFRADVSNPDEVTRLVEFATETYGPIDALVNNAGSPTDPRALRDTTWEDMERHLAVHLKGAFQCTQAVLPGMIERGFGRIVSMTSQSAYGAPPPKMTGYVVAKASLAAFTRCLALEGGPHGITANAIAPGMTDTEMVGDVPQRARMVLASQTPLRRLGGVDDIADAVSYLLGPGGSYVTGQTLHVNGGQVMP